METKEWTKDVITNIRNLKSTGGCANRWAGYSTHKHIAITDLEYQ